MQPLVSIIIPVYNTEKYVVQSINSALNQSYGCIEVIVVDDGSPDNAAMRVQEAFGKCKNVKLLRKQNGGASSARNMGLEYARGDYIVFLDSDDTLDKCAVQILAENMEGFKSDIVMPCVFHEISLDGEVSTVSVFDAPRKPIPGKQFAIDYLIKRGCAWRSTSVAYNAKIISRNHIRFQEGITGEDFIFNLNYLSYAECVSFVNYPTLNVQKRADSITAFANERLLDLFLVLDKVAFAFLVSNGFSEQESRKTADKLLIRNSVVYFTKMVRFKRNETGIKNAVDMVVEEFNEHSEIRHAFDRTFNFSMHFTTVKKRIAACVIMILLKLHLYSLAGTMAAI